MIATWLRPGVWARATITFFFGFADLWMTTFFITGFFFFTTTTLSGAPCRMTVVPAEAGATARTEPASSPPTASARIDLRIAVLLAFAHDAGRAPIVRGESAQPGAHERMDMCGVPGASAAEDRP